MAEEIIERASRRIPKLENAEVMRGVTGVYDMTPDSRPLLGEVSGVTGLHVCAGFSGMGFKISPAIGLVMSELLLDGCGKTVDISSFCPDRLQPAGRSRRSLSTKMTKSLQLLSS
jgi:sarcosine oxidase subunit beta